MTPRLARTLGRSSGVEVVEVVEGSPASQAGVRPEDLIVELNGEPVSAVDDIQRLMVADLIKDPRTSVVVPEIALQPENDKQFVFVVTANGIANKVQVTLGSRRQGVVEIVNGLNDGDLVIVEGMQDLPSGAKVAIVNTDAPADGKGQQAPAGQDRPS